MTKETQRRLTTIVAADIAGFSRLIGYDEEGILAAQRNHRTELIEPMLAEFHGRIANTAGDSFLFEFSSVVDAVRYSVAVQNGMDERNRDVPVDRRIEYRMGINVGDVVADDGDLLGDSVNIAARLEALAEPGGICISGSTYDQVRGRLKLDFDDMGPQKLKNIAEPVPTYRIATDLGFIRPTNRRRMRHWLLSGLGVSFAATVALVSFFVWQEFASGPSDPKVRSSSKITIAVLPFETSSEATKDKWLGDGIAEDIAIELSRFRDIGVVAHSSSSRYGSQPVNLKILKSEVGADFVLQGSIRLIDDHLRLSLQLVDTGTDTNRWAERYDRPFRDVFSVKADIIKQISARLFTETQDAANAKIIDRDPRSLDAFEQVLRARWSYYRYTRKGSIDSLALGEQAIELDPNYAPAWEILSRTLIQFYVQPYDRRRGDPATLKRAVTAAQKAVALDPRNSMAQATLGTAQIWAGEHEEGLQDLRRAIELNPSDSLAIGNYADGLSRAGYQKEALAVWEERRKLDSILPPLNFSLIARAHILLGDFESAYRLTSECLRKAPKILPCHLFHIMAASNLDKNDDVEASVVAIQILAPGFTVSGWKNIIKFGDPEQAEKMSAYLVNAGLNP